MIFKNIELLKNDLIKSTRELIAIKSVESSPKENMPFGENIQMALNYVLDLSSKMDFKVVNLDNYVGYAEYGEGEEYIGILGHLDVVPEGDGWNMDPFIGALSDGKIYGRGAVDDKGPMMASLYALKAIADSGIKLNKKVRIIFGTNEETGCNDIPYYLKREKPPIMGFTPDADFPVIHGEKGILIFDITKDVVNEQNGKYEIVYIKGGIRENMVPDYCEAEILTENKGEVINIYKEFLNRTSYNMIIEETETGLIIKSYGSSAHGSTPDLGENAILHLLNLLSQLSITGSVGEFVKFLNDNAYSTTGEGLGIAISDKVSGNLSFNLGIVDIKKESCIASIDIRHPVTCVLDDVLDPLKTTLNKSAIKIENFTYDAPLYFEVDHPLVKTLKEVYAGVTGENLEPITIGGGTYAKEMPNTVAFGAVFPGREDVGHKPNEYITVDDLTMCCKIYANAILKLAN